MAADQWSASASILHRRYPGSRRYAVAISLQVA